MSSHDARSESAVIRPILLTLLLLAACARGERESGLATVCLAYGQARSQLQERDVRPREPEVARQANRICADLAEEPRELRRP